jgi:transketolase
MSFGLSHIELPDGDPTRLAFGEALAEAGADESIVVLDGDVNNSTYTGLFRDRYPERFFNVGIAESNLIGIAAGLAGSGKVPVCSSFSIFLLANAFDQIRMSIAFPNQNVKLVGTHAGISIGEDGPSQMGIEDVALACALPGFTVIVPADGPSARAATTAMLEREGPTFLRCGRPAVPVVYEDGADFHVGKANELREGSDVTLVANGIMVAMALDAAAALAAEGVSARVLDMHTVKPIDRDALLAAARETGALVVAEEHLAHGGLGSVVAMTVAELKPVPIRYVNLGDQFGESGAPDALLEKFGLTAAKVVEAAQAAIAAKKG